MMERSSAVSGRVFDIQRFSLHDGPGIRTIVFMKGCALRCRWCSNPESQRPEAETLTMNGTAKTSGRLLTVDACMSEVMKDLPYYRRSGGGLTLGGGEALLQIGFAEALLAACKAEGITTAVETAGFVPREHLRRALPHTDTLLFDVKHMDAAAHKAATGQDNTRILDNARFAASFLHDRGEGSMVVRVPVVPGVNADEASIASIAAFANSLPGVRRLHLLPYHRLGMDKYAGLGRPYPMGATPPPGDALLQTLLAVVRDAGLEGQIGG